MVSLLTLCFVTILMFVLCSPQFHVFREVLSVVIVAGSMLIVFAITVLLLIVKLG